MKELIIIANAFWMKGNGIAGGDRRIIELTKRGLAEKFRIRYLVSAMAYRNYRPFLREVEDKILYQKTPGELFDKFGIEIAYLFRQFFVLFNLPFNKKDLIFYATSDFFPDVLPAVFGKMFNCGSKFVQIVHHLYPNWKDRPGNKIKNLLAFYGQKISLQIIKKAADKVIVVNPLVGEKLLEMGFSSKKIALNPNGIDFANFQKIKPGEMIEGGFIGRLHPSKGVYDLISIWEKVCLKIPEARLGIIGAGDPNLLKQLQSEVDKKNLEKNVIFYGYLEDSEAFKVLAGAKIFIFPSHEEGFGIAPLEAQALGLPVVAWNLPVFPLVFPQGMLKIKENDIDQFAQKTIDLIFDEKKRKLLAKQAVLNSMRYDWKTVAEKELKVLLNL